MEIPANYAQANLRFVGSAVPTGAEITLGLNVELYSGDPADAAGDVATAWAAADMNELQTQYIDLQSVLVKFGPNATGPAAEGGSVSSGTVLTDAVPPNTALLVTKNTGFGGRTGRGRFYIPGIPEDQVNRSGSVESAFVFQAQTAVDEFHGFLIADGLIPTLLHGADSPVSAPMPIVSFSVSSTVATQRRRLRR